MPKIDTLTRTMLAMIVLQVLEADKNGIDEQRVFDELVKDFRLSDESKCQVVDGKLYIEIVDNDYAYYLTNYAKSFDELINIANLKNLKCNLENIVKFKLAGYYALRQSAEEHFKKEIERMPRSPLDHFKNIYTYFKH